LQKDIPCLKEGKYFLYLILIKTNIWAVRNN